MAAFYWALFAGAVAVGFATFVIPLVLAEVFPWQALRDQYYGRPTVRTESYQGRTALVTGANGAFGSRAARIFAKRQIATLVLVDVRDCADLKQEIESELKAEGAPIPNIIVWQLDMSSFAACQELARRAKTLDSIDHALMTMGMLSFKRHESPEGWETTIQVNYLSNALIALLLLPQLKSSATNPSPPVLTFITSFGIYPASPTMSVPTKGSYLRHLSNNKDGMAQAHQYGRSKGLLLYFARELAARIDKVRQNGSRIDVTVNSADPGTAWTGLTAPNSASLIPRLITNLSARDPSICATALVNGVSAQADSHGKIMMDFDTAEYPPFMNRKSGRIAQQQVWRETRVELEAKAPEVRAVFEMLDVDTSD